MQNPFRRLDTYLLLHQPRLWAARIHVAVLIGLALYFAFFIIAQLLHGALNVQTAQLRAGETNSYNYGGSGGTGKLGDQFVDSLALSLAVTTQSNSVSTVSFWLFLAAFLAGMLAAIPWLRSMSRYSIDAVFGRSRMRHSWLEWLCCTLGVLIFAGTPSWANFWLSPTRTQSAQYIAVRAETKRVISRLATAKNYTESEFYNQTTGAMIPWQVVRLLSDDPEAYAFNGAVLMRPDDADFDVSIKPTTSNGYEWTVSPINARAAEYFDQLAGYTYAHAFETVTSPLGFENGLYLRVFLPWIVGLVSYMLFAGKKTRMRYVIGTVLIGALVIPIVTLIVSQIGVQLFWATVRSSSSIPYERTQLISFLSICISYALISIMTLLIALRGRFGRTASRRHVLATIAVPFIVFYGIALSVAAIGVSRVYLATSTPTSPDSVESAWLSNLFGLAVSLTPLLWGFLVPFLDGAFRRLRAAPRG
jgi:hypothetical protein